MIGLNPSTADETRDDPTIRRCIGFARDLGFGGLYITNIFAYRATDPREMKAQAEPVGADNDRALVEVAAGAGMTIAAWGVHGTHQARAAAVLALFDLAGLSLHCLGRTQDGHPRHPLYLPKNNRPMEFIEAHHATA